MAEEIETLEPPPTPQEQEEVNTAMQAAFDRAVPLKTKKKPEPEKPKLEEPPKPAEPVKPEPEKAPEPKKEEMKLPSFITEPKKEEVPAEPEVKLEELPKEAPEGADEKTKINWKKTRTLLEKQDAELKSLREKQAQKEDAGKQLSQVDAERLKQLEGENTGMREQLQRLGLQQHPKFVEEVIKPLQTTYIRAKRIIKDAGGNPEALDRALGATGQAHYTAMDEVLAELPESAKGELNATMAEYRKHVEARNEQLANAPRVLEELRKQDTLEQRNYLENQRGEMEKRFDNRIKILRDQFKFEPLVETNEEEAKWWNEIPKNVIATARKIALENQDMDVVMDASILAASAPTLRDLWLKAEARANKAEKELAQVRSAEPTVSDAGASPSPTKEEELAKLPWEKAFLNVLKNQKE